MANIKLVPLAPNMTRLDLPSGTVLFSYETPVAAYVSGRGFIRTAQKYSKTTTKHINQWLSGADAEVVPQVMINDLLEVSV